MNAMNNPSSQFPRGQSLPATVRSYLVAEPEVLQPLSSSQDGPLTPLVTLHALGAGEAVPRNILDAAQCLFIQVDPAVPGSIGRIEQVRLAKPGLPIVALIANPDFSLTRALIRQGVRDVISLPLRSGEVLSILMDVAAQQSGSRAGQAPVVALASPTGGAGATSIITHLGNALTVASPDKSVCIIDLDIQFGDVANYYGLKGKVSIVDLLEAGDRVDSDMVRDAALKSAHGPHVISAPTEINPLEMVSIERLQQVIAICRNEFDLVLLDLPSNLTNWVLSTVLACDQVLIVTETSLHSLRRARALLNLLASNGYSAGNAALVVNRYEKRFLREIDLTDVSATLHHEVLEALPLENGILAKAQDQGLLIQDLTRKTKFEKAVGELAAKLLHKIAETAR